MVEKYKKDKVYSHVNNLLATKKNEKKGFGILAGLINEQNLRI